ncbi:hypothetical protein GW813_06315 [bacterium]|nr:hypothetical protein [bacterium]PIV81251.1 MAG: hypothetical protein COW53_05405 [bacterium CG17_big_fil_post_rev_8_21_14_2_50_64_8]PJA73968.1 MAG: hypothetical protein CO151_11345 [bacterium CG_4_9_14_3_um_filter_65_15]
MNRPILILALLLLLVPLAAQAAHYQGTDPLRANERPEDLTVFLARFSFLTSLDNEHQIRLITATCEQKVDALLADLAAARTEREVGVLIRKIHRTETERDIAVLEIYIRNAEVSGEYYLAQALRDRVAQIRKFGRALDVAAAP